LQKVDDSHHALDDETDQPARQGARHPIKDVKGNEGETEQARAERQYANQGESGEGAQKDAR
jgi:hypothetical protein